MESPLRAAIAGFGVCAALLFSASCSTSAQPPAGAAPAASEAGAAPTAATSAVEVADARADVGLRCRKEQRTGSRLGRRVCTTAAEREESAREARENLETSQRDGLNPTRRE